MANKNEINEIFSYLSKNSEVNADKITQIHAAIYQSPTPPPIANSSNQPNIPSRTITKAQFETKLNETLKQKNIQEQLLYLFYNLDKDKKGYLTPEDVMSVFKVLDKNITMNQIQNSFKYVKVYKNKLTFQDFKEYFYNF